MEKMSITDYKREINSSLPAIEGNNGSAGPDLRRTIIEAVRSVPVADMHTHLFAPEFGKLNLWGIDELLNYHYLIAEFFRCSNFTYEQFWILDRKKQSELIWQTLFVENSPVSEAARGVCNVLNAFGLDTRAENLDSFREFFAGRRLPEFIDKVLKMAGVSDVVMTNDPLDEAEIEVWNSGTPIDERFHAALRLDRILNGWTEAVPLIRKQGYEISADPDDKTIGEMRRFLNDWIKKMKPVYLGVSLPDDFRFPEESVRAHLLQKLIFPVCVEHRIPLALMIGVRRRINPALKMAGDGLGRADVSVLSRICAENPDLKIFSTFLSRENQHELCVTARKFANLMPFGCWWFVNNRSIIEEIMRERLELLGTSFIAQHSDARILDQLIYKWNHSRDVIADALFHSYRGLQKDGRATTKAEIERDVKKLFSENFWQWAKPQSL